MFCVMLYSPVNKTRWEVRKSSYVYWTVRHLDSWIKRDQLDVTCFFYFIISCSTCFGCSYIHPQELATYLLSYFMGCIALVRCVLVLRCGSAGVVRYPDAGWSTAWQIFYVLLTVHLCIILVINQLNAQNLNKDRPTWCQLFYYFTIYCSTCFEC